MERLSGRDIVLTGVPRGGTTLACQLLGQCTDTVALFEPMAVADIPLDHVAAAEQVGQFFAATRQQVLETGTAPSKQHGGVVPDNPFSARDAEGRRKLVASEGLIRLPHRPESGFTLVLKHNAAFTALLPALTTRFEAYAIVRNPLPVLCSWHSVDLPVRDGHVPAGERLAPDLATKLATLDSPTERQLVILDWFFECYRQALPETRVLRYEDIVASQGQMLFTQIGLHGQAASVLSERNASRDYLASHPEMLRDELLAKGGSWEQWYPRTSIAAVFDRLTGKASV